MTPSSDEIICSEPSLPGKPAEESHLSFTMSVADNDPPGSGRDLIKRRADKSNIQIEDEATVPELCAGKEVLIEGPLDDSRYSKLLPSKSTRESLDLANSLFPVPQTTRLHREERSQEGSPKNTTVALKDEPQNLTNSSWAEVPFSSENLEEIFDLSVSQVTSDGTTSDRTCPKGLQGLRQIHSPMDLEMSLILT